MAKAAKKAGLPAECKAHGLRKTLLRRLAEAGRSTKQIAAMSGHKSLKEIERYTVRPIKRSSLKKRRMVSKNFALDTFGWLSRGFRCKISCGFLRTCKG